MDFGYRVQELIDERGLTQKQITADLGIGKNSIARWKKGLSSPNPATQQLFAKYFGVSVEYLMGQTNNPIPNSETVGTYIPYKKRGVRPVIGWASAGTGVIAEEMIIGWEPVDDEYDTDECFWLEVNGDSMSPRIDNGDRVLVQRDVDIESGNVAVVIVDGTEGFLKQIAMDDTSITLHSYNPYYPDRVFTGPDRDRVRFVGRVVEMKRRF